MSTSTSQERVPLQRLGTNALWIGVIGVVAYGALLVWNALAFVLLPFAAACLLAALLMPVAVWLHVRLRLPRIPAAILTVLLLVVLVVGLLGVIVPDVVQQAEQLGSQVQAGIDGLPAALRDLGVQNSDVQRYTRELTSGVQDALSSAGGGIGAGAITAVRGVANVGAGLFLMLVFLVYLLVDGTGFWRGVLRFAPGGRRAEWHAGGQRAWRAVTGYVRSQALVAVIDGIGVWVGLSLLGIPSAVPLAVLTFLLAFVPYLGAVIAGLASMLVALSSNGIGGLLGALAVAVVVQQLEGNVLYPLLIGRSVRLHAITVLLGVGAGTALLGFVGALLSTPLIAATAAAAGWLRDDTEPPGPAPEDLMPPQDDPLATPVRA